jgi:nitroreductase/NAD-dependent dihydropyrimidine dehydrogenase PreA subunit
MNQDNLLKVYKEKCISCGLCIKDCPASIIEFDNNKIPKIINQKEPFCIKCGHCVAICPTSSLDHKFSDLNKSIKINKNLIPDSESIFNFLKSRRSIRIFEKRNIPNDTLTELIDIAGYAPTGRNALDVQWIVINDNDSIDKIKSIIIKFLESLIGSQNPISKLYPVETILNSISNGNDPLFRNAKTIVIAKAGENSYCKEQDVDIALSHFELAALSKGIGSCWLGGLAIPIKYYKPLRDELGLKEEYNYAIGIGYPKYCYNRQPYRETPKITFYNGKK